MSDEKPGATATMTTTEVVDDLRREVVALVAQVKANTRASARERLDTLSKATGLLGKIERFEVHDTRVTVRKILSSSQWRAVMYEVGEALKGHPALMRDIAQRLERLGEGI